VLLLPRTHASLANPLIVTGTATGFAAAYALIRAEPPALVSLYVSLGPLVSLIAWTAADLRHSKLASVYDWGLLQFLAWPVLIPWYLKRRYGAGAWPLLVIFVLLLAAPHLAARIRPSP
jgi:hypothetical protein